MTYSRKAFAGTAIGFVMLWFGEIHFKLLILYVLVILCCLPAGSINISLLKTADARDQLMACYHAELLNYLVQFNTGVSTSIVDFIVNMNICKCFQGKMKA